jgi:hypothetical protein
VLLFVALLAIVFSCLLLVMEMWSYGFDWNPPQAKAKPPVPAAAPDVLIV